MAFGLNQSQLREAGSISKRLAHDWRELMVGVEGYLIDRGRVGLDRQAVVWGDMVGRRNSQLPSISPVTSLIVLCFQD
jgi:hypothetical protein